MRLFLFLFCFIALNAQAQTRAELIEQLTTFYQEGEFEKALGPAKKAIEAAGKEVGIEHAEYAVALNDLASIYFQLGEYEKAEPLLLNALTIRKKALGENDPFYVRNLRDLANDYHWMGDFTRSASYYLQAAGILQHTSGLVSESYSTNLYDLGMVYYNGGLYEKAEPVAIKLKSLRQALYGPEHTEYATSVSLLGLIFLAMGQYDKAESHLLEASFIEKKEGTETDYATSRSNLANLYLVIGHYKKAEPILLEVVEIKKRRMGTDHADYAFALDNLSVLYSEIQEYEKAVILSEEALAVRKKVLGESDPAYLRNLHNLASIYLMQDKFKEAEKLLNQVISIKKKVLGEQHPDYATSLGNLASLYFQTGRSREAGEVLLKCLAIQKMNLGEQHPDYAATLNSLALLSSSIGQLEKAEGLMIKSNLVTKENITRTFVLLAEKEKQEFLENKVTIIDDNGSLLFNHKKVSKRFTQHSFEQVLFFKSLLLSDSRNMLNMIQNSDDSTVRSRFGRWSELRRKLAEQYSLPPKERDKNIAKMETDAEFLEKLLMYQSAAFRRQQAGRGLSSGELQKALKPGEAAIEFVRFDLFNKQWTDSTIYAAYILRGNDSIPVFVPLCEEGQLQKIFDSAGINTTEMVSKFYRGLEGKSKSNAGALGLDLYKLIWAPLEPHLKGIKTISYSPAGKLYSIAFQALPADSSMLLIDKYELRQYSSTREIVQKDETTQPEKLTGAVLFGDPAFSIDTVLVAGSKPGQGATATGNLTASLTRSSNDTTWLDLPGTAIELEKVRKLFDENKIASTSYTRAAASEEQFKALSGRSPQLLHIATHGFFLPEADTGRKEKSLQAENSYTLSQDPLLRSGLILSGANYTWSGKSSIPGREDGIVTAYEISQLDLTKTELVVLSACETALGDVKGNEGVFGLQRAFKMAGVKKMIVSLWQVPDKETAELMTSFYGYRFKGSSIEEAFGKAQAEMRKKYSAFYWAAFVLVE